MKICLAICAAAVLSATIAAPAWAEDGGAMFKTKCAMCHGDHGQGKPPMGPKLAGTPKSEADIFAVLTKGGEKKAPHIKPISSLTPEQAKSVATFVKSLK
jgi:mono/diheme cytochrome c family protein